MEHGRQAVARVDVIGLGAGVHNWLNAEWWPVESFYSELALPSAHREELIKELTATSWTITGTGKIQITAKRDIKTKLGGASPDFADTLAMACAHDGMLSFDTPLASAEVAF